MQRIFLGTILIGIQAVSASAQAPAAGRKEEPAHPADTIAPVTVAKRPNSAVATPDSNVRPARGRPYTLSVFTAGVYDSNIDRDLADIVASRGFVYGGGVRFRDVRPRPRFNAAYEIAQHDYTNTDEYDRISHHLNGMYALSITPSLLLENIVDIGIRGSSEDRDVGNQYTYIPRLNYRLSSNQRLRLYGAYRLRRYDIDASRNAHNRYVGLEFRDEADDGAEWEYGFRYETNSARSTRRSYTRRTYSTGYARTFGERTDMVAGVKYRSQRYDKRSIEAEGEDVPRHDHRISPTVEVVYRLGGGVSVAANYDFESRTSNDPGNGYKDHIFTLTGRFDW